MGDSWVIPSLTSLTDCSVYIVILVGNSIANLFIKSYDAGIKNKVYLTWRLSCISENYSMVSLEEQ